MASDWPVAVLTAAIQLEAMTENGRSYSDFTAYGYQPEQLI